MTRHRRTPVALPRATGVLLTLVTAAGCYDYVPLSTGAERPAAEVELTLTDSGAVVLARDIGRASTAIDGTLVSGGDASAYTIAVRQVRRRDDDPAPWRGEHIVVPRPLVAEVRERRLSRTRTALATVGTAAGVLLARAAIRGLGGSNAGQSGPGTNPGPK
ncbi:hypothetical protein [Gemmatirosa kalamazoonensis]|uniref:hypothetical protein n=1 Tax=Gemmatirosa kalamazoonensis TaxID=861299 RepID=UPI00130DDF08|nr:hypothetical protein [Gemmatirosa kalamazoonensis]